MLSSFSIFTNSRLQDSTICGTLLRDKTQISKTLRLNYVSKLFESCGTHPCETNLSHKMTFFGEIRELSLFLPFLKCHSFFAADTVLRVGKTRRQTVTTLSNVGCHSFSDSRLKDTQLGTNRFLIFSGLLWVISYINTFFFGS